MSLSILATNVPNDEGYPYTAENPYIAKNRLQALKKYLPVACNRIGDDNVPKDMFWSKPLEELPVMRLSGNIVDAMRMMTEINEIQKRLPNLDCGTCGAPSCKALAEDIVKGYGSINDCMFMLRKQLDDSEMENLIPAPYREDK